MNCVTPQKAGNDTTVTLWDALPVFLRQMAGPIRQWLESPDVIEIMCNRPGEVWIEARGRPHMERFEVPELTGPAIARLAQMIAGGTSQSVNAETPLLSAAMPNGERFQGVLSPVAATGGAFAIRKQVIKDMSLDDYQAMGCLDGVRVSGPRHVDADDISDLDREILGRLADPSGAGRRELLRFAVQNRVTMLISGGTSTGKTTFFNAILKDVPDTERIISIEDTRELKPPQPNYLPLVASKGGQGLARTTIQDCLEAALRLRPDRIFMGEIRGAEAYSFLQAVNTGHQGSLSTLHADNPRGAFERAAMATLQAGLGLTKSELMDFVRLIVPMVIQINRDPHTGRRGVSEIYFNRWRAAP